MGILQWLTDRLGRDLDARVHGATGLAHARFAGLVDDAPLSIAASVTGAPNATVTLSLRTTPRDEEGTNGDAGEPRTELRQAMHALATELGLGKRYRNTELSLEAMVVPRHNGGRPASESVIALVLELAQTPGGGAAPVVESYSVESRPESGDAVTLTLVVHLG